MSSHIEIYRETVPQTYRGEDYVPEHPGDWRWRFVFGNTKTGADGGEGYKRKKTMLRSMAHVLGGVIVEGPGLLGLRRIDIGSGDDPADEILEIRKVES